MMIEINRVPRGGDGRERHGSGNATFVAAAGLASHPLSNMALLFCLFLNHTVCKLFSSSQVWAGIPDISVFNMCPRVGSSGPTRRPDCVKAPRLLGPGPSCWLLRVAATTDPFPFTLLLSYPRLTSWAPRVPEVHAVLSVLPASATRSRKLMCCPCGRSLSYVALVLCKPVTLDEPDSFLHCKVASAEAVAPP